MLCKRLCLNHLRVCCCGAAVQLCSYPIQSGATVSRAKVYTFKHNDMADLERVFQKLEAEERKQKG